MNESRLITIIFGCLLILRDPFLEPRGLCLHGYRSAEYEMCDFPLSLDDVCDDTRLLKYDIRVPSSYPVGIVMCGA